MLLRDKGLFFFIKSGYADVIIQLKCINLIIICCQFLCTSVQIDLIVRQLPIYRVFPISGRVIQVLVINHLIIVRVAHRPWIRPAVDIGIIIEIINRTCGHSFEVAQFKRTDHLRINGPIAAVIRTVDRPEIITEFPLIEMSCRAFKYQFLKGPFF